MDYQLDLLCFHSKISTQLFEILLSPAYLLLFILMKKMGLLALTSLPYILKQHVKLGLIRLNDLEQAYFANYTLKLLSTRLRIRNPIESF